MKVKWIQAFLFALVCVIVSVGSAAAAGEAVFNKYNIHAQDLRGHIKASYANYIDPGAGHLIIPAGTEMVIAKLSRKLIVLRLQDGRRIEFEFHEQRMGMSANEYVQLITSPVPVSLDKFSSVDKEGISQGKCLEGMSKAGVMTALGYPAAHRTSSPEANTWVYWTNRFGTRQVTFNDQGKVIGVKD